MQTIAGPRLTLHPSSFFPPLPLNPNSPAYNLQKARSTAALWPALCTAVLLDDDPAELQAALQEVQRAFAPPARIPAWLQTQMLHPPGQPVPSAPASPPGTPALETTPTTAQDPPTRHTQPHHQGTAPSIPPAGQRRSAPMADVTVNVDGLTGLSPASVSETISQRFGCMIDLKTSIPVFNKDQWFIQLPRDAWQAAAKDQTTVFVSTPDGAQLRVTPRYPSYQKRPLPPQSTSSAPPLKYPRTSASTTFEQPSPRPPLATTDPFPTVTVPLHLLLPNLQHLGPLGPVWPAPQPHSQLPHAGSSHASATPSPPFGPRNTSPEPHTTRHCPTFPDQRPADPRHQPDTRSSPRRRYPTPPGRRPSTPRHQPDTRARQPSPPQRPRITTFSARGVPGGRQARY